MHAPGRLEQQVAEVADGELLRLLPEREHDVGVTEPDDAAGEARPDVQACGLALEDLGRGGRHFHAISAARADALSRLLRTGDAGDPVAAQPEPGAERWRRRPRSCRRGRRSVSVAARPDGPRERDPQAPEAPARVVAQEARDLGAREPRAPRVVGREVVVRVVDRAQVGERRRRPTPPRCPAVRPPEVEKKNVCATAPPASTTRPRVARTASLVVRDLAGDAAVDLRAHVGVDVVGRARRGGS